MIRVDQPERNLLASVIRQASRDLIGNIPADVTSAFAFFTLPGSRLPWMCQALGLDLDSVREHAREQAEARLEWLEANPGQNPKTVKIRASLRDLLAVALRSGAWRRLRTGCLPSPSPS